MGPIYSLLSMIIPLYSEITTANVYQHRILVEHVFHKQRTILLTKIGLVAESICIFCKPNLLTTSRKHWSLDIQINDSSDHRRRHHPERIIIVCTNLYYSRTKARLWFGEYNMYNLGNVLSRPFTFKSIIIQN